MVRLGIIGCGAVTEFSYLPAIAGLASAKIVALVDKDLKRASRLAREYNIEDVKVDYRDIADKVDAVIIAVPNQFHCEVAVFFLLNKIHTLIEKPMATSPESCDIMIKAAERSGCNLAVGHVRRFFNSSRLIKHIIDNGYLGSVESFSLKEGGVFNWPTASGFYFSPSLAGGGVLMDTGSHLLDLMVWWLGYPEKFAYYDDNFGGVEATSILKVEMQNGANGLVKMTRLVPIDSGFTIQGTKGAIRARPFAFNSVLIHLDGMPEYEIRNSSKWEIQHYFRQQVTDFIDSINQHKKPFVDGYEARRVIQFIKECYNRRQPLQTPWLWGFN